MNCPKCHASIPSDAAFCPECGENVARPAPAAAPSPGVRTFSGMNTVAPMREHRASALEPGTIFAERYEVRRKLGEGGMGVVYVALDKHTGEELVLKLIHPDLVTGDEAIKRLMAEGLTARQIRHPNIVAVYDVAQWNGQPYFSMEFVKGGTLRSWMVDRISSRTDVKLETAAGIIRTMLKGLAEAHRMGVVHRDLKPENVLLCGDPDAGDFNLKILDFGIAKAINSPRSGSGSSGAIGTPLYMAPEQMTSAEAVGPAADIYSLSVMFYELLMEASPQARWESISRNRPDVPKTIDDLIEKGLSARPRSRYGSVAEYETALDAAMKGVSPAPGPVRPEPVRPEPVRPEPVRPEPPPPPPPPPPIEPEKSSNLWGGQFGSLSKNAKMWAAVGAVVLVLAAIGSFMDADGDGDGIADEEDGCPTLAGPSPTGCPDVDDNFGPAPPSEPPTTPTTVPQAAAVQERWNIYLAQSTFPFAIVRTGDTFTGTGLMPNIGPVQVSGSLARGNVHIAVQAPGGMVYNGPATHQRSTSEPQHFDLGFNGWLLHINH